MSDPQLIWWCNRAQMAILQNRPDGIQSSCGPDQQCRAGAKSGAPCGWYHLVPADGPEPEPEPQVEREPDPELERILEPPGWEPPESLTVGEVLEMAAEQADDPGSVAGEPDVGYHIEEGWYVCNTCGDDFPKKAGIKTHLRQHVKPEPCPYGCDRMVKPGQGVTRHLRAGCPALNGQPPPAPAPAPEPEPAPAPAPAPAPEPPAPKSALRRATAPRRAPAPAASPHRAARVVSSERTAEARDAARAKTTTAPARKRRAVAPPEEDAPPPPLKTRSSWTCGWVDEAGKCGRQKELEDVGWKRRRRPAGHVDLCPDHADVDDDELDELLDEQLATS